MSPRTGRPKSDNPKSEQVGIRINAEDERKLAFCMDRLGIKAPEVFRRGLDRLYYALLADEQAEAQATKKDRC